MQRWHSGFVLSHCILFCYQLLAPKALKGTRTLTLRLRQSWQPVLRFPGKTILQGGWTCGRKQGSMIASWVKNISGNLESDTCRCSVFVESRSKKEIKVDHYPWPYQVFCALYTP